MSFSRTDLHGKIKDVLRHVEPMSPEAETPLLHYQRSADNSWNLREYMGNKLKSVPHSPKVLAQHMARLHGMLLVNLVEIFERFLKETAAVCVDQVGRFVHDDRFDGFPITGSKLAVHFGAQTLGQALCESLVWLDTDKINARFLRLLAEPFEAGKFELFPRGKKGSAERARFDALNILWQLRNTIVHNAGVLTQSDAIEFKLLLGEPVEAPRKLVPTRDDLYYAKRLMDETAESANTRIGERLAELLTSIYAGNPILFVPQDAANRLTKLFGRVLTVAGATGTLPPP